MPRIFDNIKEPLLPALRTNLEHATRADFCVGYFNLRGWRQIDSYLESWAGGDGACCRLLVGMQKPPQEELRQALSMVKKDGVMDNQTALRLKKKLAEEFREQLTLGIPNNEDEAGLRRLVEQLKSKQVIAKLFVRHLLHAKLYLVFRNDYNNPVTGFLGSSNLTFSGLSHQGELNIDVLEHDAANKLKDWFEDRWNDNWSIDISNELIQIIEESWARKDIVPPYHIYLKIAYHLSQEARAGLSEFSIPRDFGASLFDFQTAAVKIAAHHVNKRNGVVIGDVVGLGKSLMASALAYIFQNQPYYYETLIICPTNLVKMWQDYKARYRLIGDILPLSQVKKLENMRRYRLVLIDESHNLRNREGKGYAAIRDYIEKNDSKVVLLSATPYNKTYLDLSNQLRLFLPEDKALGIRPERLLRDMSPDLFLARHQCALDSVAAFEKSPYPDDWRELMRLYLVRRTRSFIKENYAEKDETSNRRYLTFESGKRFYFPERKPKTVKFKIDESNPDDQYARLYADDVVDTINTLWLPRYGLGNYVAPKPHQPPTPAEAKQLDNLGRAGQRLMGFCRTNLFKRLESSGYAFLQSIERHVLRNCIFIHALEKGLDLPIGAQDAGLLDTSLNDEDRDMTTPALAVMADVSTDSFGDDDNEVDNDDDEADDFVSVTNGAVAVSSNGKVTTVEKAVTTGKAAAGTKTASGAKAASTGKASLTGKANGDCANEADFKRQAAEVYGLYSTQYKKRFKWLRASLFTKALVADLKSDNEALLEVLKKAGAWHADQDAKLSELQRLLEKKHPKEKVLVFTQFADTAHYLEKHLVKRGIQKLTGVTGGSADPTALAWRFSPESNDKNDPAKEGYVSPEDELRVLVATDVLSEGQNLQDCAVIVNFDLPWAIIRLIQRVGRVDRIGQTADTILCYSFLPADGVERILNLRSRVTQRLKENAEVVGTDEVFFEDSERQAVLNLYNEKSTVLEGDDGGEVDLASQAYQIWKNATDADPSLKKTIPSLPPVVYSTKPHQPTVAEPEGVLVYMRTSEDNDALAWIDENGNSVTESHLTILKAAQCAADTAALPRAENHHELVSHGVAHLATQEKTVGGGLGKPSGARYKTYQRLHRYAQEVKGTLLDLPQLARAIDAMYRYPLRPVAVDMLNSQLKIGVSDETLADLVMALFEEGRLCRIEDEPDTPEPEPRIICSLGLAAPGHAAPTQ